MLKNIAPSASIAAKASFEIQASSSRQLHVSVNLPEDSQQDRKTLVEGTTTAAGSTAVKSSCLLPLRVFRTYNYTPLPAAAAVGHAMHSD